jgi:monoterpene epsilon-lactone hydrolase
MSFQSRLGCWWIRLTMKRKPPGEAALVDFTRRRFSPPDWIVALHSSGMNIQPVNGDVKGEWIVPEGSSQNTSVLYYLHGGGYISGSAKTNRPLTIPLARMLKRRTFSLDYRLAPENRFPAAVEDAIAGYRWLVSSGIDPGSICVAGDSAGGGLTLALSIALRDRGEKLPACLVCLSPWTDMTGSGESIATNSERDPMFAGEDIPRYAAAYLGNKSPRDPLASPLFADLAALPPILIQVARNEVLLDDARALHEKVIAAGGSSELRIFDCAFHGWHFGTPFVPEARRALQDITEFVRRQLS